MKRFVNFLLVAIFIGCVIWAAVAPGMQAIIPLIIAQAAAIALVDRNTDWITHF